MQMHTPIQRISAHDQLRIATQMESELMLIDIAVREMVSKQQPKKILMHILTQERSVPAQLHIHIRTESALIRTVMGAIKSDAPQFLSASSL